MRLKRHGVRIGSGGRFIGQPIIRLHRGEQLSIGDRFVGVSTSSGTALGVRGPVIFRTLSPDAQIDVGDDTGMSGTVVCAAVSVQIGARCLIGADCMIFDTDFHPHAASDSAGVPRRYAQPAWQEISSPVTLGDDVFLGTRSIVTKGVSIGAGTIIAAGSVVTRNIPSNVIAGGIPATIIRPAVFDERVTA